MREAREWNLGAHQCDALADNYGAKIKDKEGQAKIRSQIRACEGLSQML